MKKFSVNSFNIIFFILFGWILILMMSTLIQDSPAILIMLIAFGAVGIWRVRESSLLWTWHASRRSFYCILLTSCMVMLVFAFKLEVKLSWDWGQLLTTSSKYVLTGKIVKKDYFARYPNNQVWLTCLIVFFKVIKKVISSIGMDGLKKCSMILSCIFVQLTILISYETARLIWNEKKAFLTGCMMTVFSPLYLYAMFAYTDTIGMLLVAILLYLYVLGRKVEGEKRLLVFLLFGMFSVLSYRIKPPIGIVVIAIILDSLFRIKAKKQWAAAVAITVVAMGATLFVNIQVTQHIIPINSSQKERYEFPKAHWIMMALNTTGGYNPEDVKYTESFDTYKKKQNADLAEIRNRLKKRGMVGTLEHVLNTKTKRMWCYPGFGGDDYVGRSPVHKGIFQRIFTQKGDLHFLYYGYAALYYCFLLIAIAVSAVLSVKKKVEEQPLLVGRITLFGTFIFFAVWECNSRYLVALSPVLILTAVEGVCLLTKQIRKHRGIH